jgi:uncharacterized protein YqhQ
LPDRPKFSYGGQAVIEGVMIRGRSHFTVAVRRQDGRIDHRRESLSTLYTGRARQLPLIRGIVTLAETLVLGVKALHLSANMALKDQQSEGADEIPGWLLGATLAFALVLGVGVFFLLPLFIVWALDSVIPSGPASDVAEGVLRLAILVAYIWGISFLKDIKRVFAYHGAEHMAVHAYEAGLPLSVGNVRKFGTPHPRCGTAFLLTVALVSIIIFALLMTPSMEWRIVSRVVLIPVIAAVSYEIIRFSGAHQHWLIGQLLSRPGLLLQRLTTRAPDDSQIEVAICAMEAALAADAGREYTLGHGSGPASLDHSKVDGTGPEERALLPAPINRESPIDGT